VTRSTAPSLPTGLPPSPTTSGDRVPVTVVGDVLLDVDWTGRVDRICPDAPVPVLDAAGEERRPGGAGLAAVCAAAAGARVTLVTALGRDAEGAFLRTALDRAGIEVVDLGLDGGTPTKLRLRAGGQSLVRVDRNCSPTAAVGAFTDAATAAVGQAAAVLVSDYGRGMAANPVLSVLLQQRAGAAGPGAPVVWDPHPRGPRPPAGLDLLTPNLGEATGLLAATGTSPADGPREAAVALSRTFEAAVALTTGSAGAELAEPGAEPVTVPVEPASGDVCGAGDRFAATVAVERARGASRHAAVAAAVEAARDHVLGDTPWVPPGATAGKRVVATGGCFDVLHAGHVRLLEAARRLGDELVVCLNGDLSVRRLKGPHRPINRVEDRAAVLRGLGCVDDVVVFEEDTPCQALRRVRPALFVKGDDYADRPLPERDVLAEWGGQVVLLPVVPGRSTTRILHAAAASASAAG
jgi:rfaE bifunctional protein nucleotidyltransferase chain/domain/rfaE bifunctional protein kinase chain/domain